MTLPSQSHVYMETQTAVAVPHQESSLLVHSATQSLDAVQSAVAGVLGLAFNQVTVGGSALPGRLACIREGQGPITLRLRLAGCGLH
jgi:xanthine dehydrogenase large subunit